MIEVYLCFFVAKLTMIMVTVKVVSVLIVVQCLYKWGPPMHATIYRYSRFIFQSFLPSL